MIRFAILGLLLALVGCFRPRLDIPTLQLTPSTHNESTVGTCIHTDRRVPIACGESVGALTNRRITHER